ncbi:MAG: threonylcarbamoyl-AMP synthase [Lentisphaeria bacterium]|nr:threonylcarbamoyl-AMP synthase [Lentisphaeria bacterium]
MIIIPLHDTPSTELVDQISQTLRNGGVVLVPTETVYGLMTLSSNSAGVNKISKIKQRDDKKHYQILINSVEMADQLGAKFSRDATKLADQFWPGGLTLIVATDQSKTLGLRYPSHKLIEAIIDQIKEPLVATSANICGQDPITNVKDIKHYFGQHTPDLVIDAGEISGKASTVIDCSQENTQILREGAITVAQIKEILNHE